MILLILKYQRKTCMKQTLLNLFMIDNDDNDDGILHIVD